jgi:zinc transporter ZupT
MEYLFLLSSIVLGAVCVFAFKLYEARHVKLLNAFTGAYLLCLTLLHMLPELYHLRLEGEAAEKMQLLLGTLILAGFFTQIALDFISMGVEHGHSHPLHGGGLPIGVVAGLCLHALVEAMALGDSHSHYDVGSRKLLLVSIVFHNFPVSIALLGMLLQSGISRRVSLSFLALFAGMAPLGMLISSHSALGAYSRELMAFVIGIFMHISTTIIFESSDVHRFNRAKLGAIVVGTVLGYLSVMFH